MHLRLLSAPSACICGFHRRHLRPSAAFIYAICVHLRLSICAICVHLRLLSAPSACICGFYLRHLRASAAFTYVICVHLRPLSAPSASICGFHLRNLRLPSARQSATTALLVIPSRRDPLHVGTRQSRRNETQLRRDRRVSRTRGRAQSPCGAGADSGTRHHRRRQGKCLWARGGADCAGARRCRRRLAGGGRPRRRYRAARVRRPRAHPRVWRAQRQQSRRCVYTRPHADDCKSVSRARTPGRSRRARHPRALSPQDRHRYASSRVPSREPHAHAAGASRQPESRARSGVYAFRNR